MNKLFLLATQPKEGLAATVFATGAVNPLEDLDQLEKELAQKKVVGNVLFDMLLTQGSKRNRYFVGKFDGHHFNKAQIQPTQEYSPFSAFSAEFLKKHYAEIDTVLLSKAMKFALQKGLDF